MFWQRMSESAQSTLWKFTYPLNEFADSNWWQVPHNRPNSKNQQNMISNLFANDQTIKE